MSWTAPRTWVAGEIVTASIMNSAVRDNLRYLKGLDGIPTIESGLTIDNTDGDERLLLPLLSTAECSTVLNTEGEVAFDEQTHRAKYYDGSAIGSVVTTIDVDDTPADSATTDPISSNWAYDHVAAADPHTGYVLESLATAQSDILYSTAANTWAALAKGTALQVLRMNSGATAPEWTAGESAVEIVYKSAGETVNNSITLQNDDDLLFAVGANEKWHFFLYLIYTSSAVADFKFAFTVPATGALQRITAGLVGALTGETGVLTEQDGTAVLTLAGAGAYRVLLAWYRYSGGNAGNIQLQWAQDTQEVSDTIVSNGSHIIAFKLA
jgi:uncharacterized membrane protein